MTKRLAVILTLMVGIANLPSRLSAVEDHADSETGRYIGEENGTRVYESATNKPGLYFQIRPVKNRGELFNRLEKRWVKIVPPGYMFGSNDTRTLGEKQRDQQELERQRQEEERMKQEREQARKKAFADYESITGKKATPLEETYRDVFKENPALFRMLAHTEARVNKAVDEIVADYKRTTEFVVLKSQIDGKKNLMQFENKVEDIIKEASEGKNTFDGSIAEIRQKAIQANQASEKAAQTASSLTNSWLTMPQIQRVVVDGVLGRVQRALDETGASAVERSETIMNAYRALDELAKQTNISAALREEIQGKLVELEQAHARLLMRSAFEPIEKLSSVQSQILKEIDETTMKMQMVRDNPALLGQLHALRAKLFADLAKTYSIPPHFK